MNIKKTGLVMAVLVAGLLLVGAVGCRDQEAREDVTQLQTGMTQLQTGMTQLLQEKQEREAKEQKATEEEGIVQIVAKVVGEKLGAFETKLAEKKKEDELAELKRKVAELESQSTQPSQPSSDVCPSPDPYSVPTVVWFEGGKYRFCGHADDGFRLYIDRCLILDRRYVSGSHEVVCPVKRGYHSVWLKRSERRTGCADISWARVNSYYLWR